MKNLVKLVISMGFAFFSLQAQAVPSGPTLQGGCSIADLTTSVSCIGVYDPGNDHGTHNIFNDSAFQSFYPGTWTQLTKIEDDNSWTDPTSIGLTITGQGGTSGTWNVNSDAWDGFAQGEILAVLKAGTNAAAYEVDVDYISGTWSVASSAWDGSGLSHFSFWTTSTSVPEPSILVLLSMGLLGLGLFRRKTKV
jgi:hypothetical protein